MTSPRSLPGYPATVLAAVRAAEVDGRLPAPSAEVLGDIFPFEPDVRVVPFGDPVLPEPARHGEGGTGCGTCALTEADLLWTDGDWGVRALPQPLGVHALFLEPRRHADLRDLGEDEAAQLGRLIVRVERVLSAELDGVGRVHVNRWGDGGSHLHIWFLARPAGLVQLRGSQLPTWLDVLPPLPREVWVKDLDRIAAALHSAAS